MDPNAARSKMIEKANQILALEGRVLKVEEHEHMHAQVIELAEAVHDLDEWLRASGFLPDVWLTPGQRAIKDSQAGRKQDVDV